jgi:hypothetical protein
MTADVVPDALLHLLERHYGHQWSIRRSGGLWVATATSDRITHAPTLIEEDVEVFVQQLEHPPAGIGGSGPLSPHVHESGFRSEDVRDGPLEG